MYLDKLDGRVDSTFFDKMSAQWREEQNRCLCEIERHEAAEQSYMDEGVQILELARNAQKLFEQQQPREKRRLLNFVLSNCSWEDGEVVATFRQPFDLLAQTTAIATRAKTSSGSNSAKSEIWLPFLGTYRTMCRAPDPAFRLILEDVRELPSNDGLRDAEETYGRNVSAPPGPISEVDLFRDGKCVSTSMPRYLTVCGRAIAARLAGCQCGDRSGSPLSA